MLVLLMAFLLILGICRICEHIGSHMCTAYTFNTRKFVLFTHLKLMMSIDLFLPILCHEVGTNFRSVSELRRQRKKPHLMFIGATFSAAVTVKQVATGRRVWLSPYCKRTEVQ